MGAVASHRGRVDGVDTGVLRAHPPKAALPTASVRGDLVSQPDPTFSTGAVMPDTWPAWSAFFAIVTVILGTMLAVVRGWIDKGDEHAIDRLAAHEQACEMRMRLLDERHAGIQNALNRLLENSERRRRSDG